MIAMERTHTQRLVLKQGDNCLELERRDVLHASLSHSEGVGTADTPGRKADYILARGYEDRAPLAPIPEKNLDLSPGIYVTSPMVGTFYSAGSPEDPPFVKVGDSIGKDTVVCIVEAMKVMNEIKANVSGTVAEILVDNGHPVEFGAKLFRIE